MVYDVNNWYVNYVHVISKFCEGITIISKNVHRRTQEWISMSNIYICTHTYICSGYHVVPLIISKLIYLLDVACIFSQDLSLCFTSLLLTMENHLASESHCVSTVLRARMPQIVVEENCWSSSCLMTAHFYYHGHFKIFLCPHLSLPSPSLSPSFYMPSAFQNIEKESAAKSRLQSELLMQFMCWRQFNL